MRARVLVDTGPLVAMMSTEDSSRSACVEQMEKLYPPLLTCWPVITEAAWLLRSRPDRVQQLIASFEAGFVALLPLDEADTLPIAAILKKYQKIGAQLADACLVHLAERESIDTVFTLDHRDFRAYRVRGNKALRIVPPP